VLTLRSIAVSLAGRSVLAAIDLDVARGEIVAVVGPNGAGKSTLLSAVLGVVPHAGAVAIDGVSRATFAERAPCIAYLPDAMIMPDETTLSRALSSDPAGAWAEKLGVSTLASRRASATSRGELARAALAAALDLPGRKLLLLDEPFGALDPRQLASVLPIVREACAERAALITIHQLGVAERVADRIALLSRGTLLAVGRPAELRERAGLTEKASLEEAFLALLAIEAGDAGAAA
jgi:ABC-type multidrug transport system ATPase subunit